MSTSNDCKTCGKPVAKYMKRMSQRLAVGGQILGLKCPTDGCPATFSLVRGEAADKKL